MQSRPQSHVHGSRRQAIQNIGRQFLDLAEAKFGTHDGAGRADLWLSYHNRGHNHDVGIDARAAALPLIAAGDLQPGDEDLAELWGFAHDAIQEVGVGPWIEKLQAAGLHEPSYDGYTNESLTAEMLADRMQQARTPDGAPVFSAREVQRAYDAIEGTTVTGVDRETSTILQRARDSDDPLVRAVGDGDLAGACGSTRGTHRGLLLLIEEKAKRGELEDVPQHVSQIRDLPLDQGEVVAYLERQERFHGEHRFILPTTEANLRGQRDRNQAVMTAYRERVERADASEVPAMYSDFVDLSRAYARTGELPPELAAEIEPTTVMIDLATIGAELDAGRPVDISGPLDIDGPEPAPVEAVEVEDLDDSASGLRPNTRSVALEVDPLPEQGPDLSRGSGPMELPTDELRGWELGFRQGGSDGLDL